MKRIIALSIFTALLLVVCLPVSAHSNLLGTTFDKTTRDNKTYVGSEAIGWMIDESCHTNGQHFTYKCAAGMSPSLINLIANGANKWGNNDPFKIEYDSTSIGTVMVSAQVIPNAWAEFCCISKDSSGHLTSWIIKLNSAKISDITSLIIAHEFGHVFGLNDLYSTSNNNKLMYYYHDPDNNIPNVTGPTSKDKWGAKVITGYHTSHSWEYVYFSVNKHRHRCTSCGGFKTQACTPDANGYCTKCGHYFDYSGNGMLDPTAALLPNADEERRFMIGILI